MHANEKGQVLPMGLVLVAFAMAGALMLFNTGQVATDKMRLANSADAAAYSGALWQARALNYQAYANRAMVANQVAIGQAVSLQSWMRYAKVTSEHIATALKPVPVINVVTSGVSEAVALAEKGVSLGAQTMLTATNVATRALSLSQEVMHAATLVNTPEIIDVVAAETDARFTTHSAYGIANKAANTSQWRAFNKQYTNRDKAAMAERQQLIMDSRDTFTTARNWDLFDFWVPSTPLTWHKLRRQGQTQLTAVDTPGGLEWEWMAKDTLSLHNRVIGFFNKKDSEIPISWASAFANSTGSAKPIKRQTCGSGTVLGAGASQPECARYTQHNHRAEGYADTNVRSVGTGSDTRQSMKIYGGVRAFRDLSDDARSAEDARLTVRVEVSLPARQVHDSADIIQSGQMSHAIVTAGHTLSSISAADVFYRRPRHHFIASSRREKANLYNPYWQAQLVPVSQKQRLLAISLRAGGSTPNTREPVSEDAAGLGTYREL